jgi:D-alanine-D-alanine ligase
LSPELTQRVQAVARRAHQALGCRDLSRTDIRLRDGVPYVLEVNPLPGMDPHESNFPIMTTAAGIAYPTFIQRVVELAVARSRDMAPAQEPSLVESRRAP